MEHEWDPINKHCDKCSKKIEKNAYYYTTQFGDEFIFCDFCQYMLNIDSYVYEFLGKVECYQIEATITNDQCIPALLKDKKC